MDDYNQYVTAVNKIFDYISKMRAGWPSMDNTNYIESIEEFKNAVTSNADAFKKAPDPSLMHDDPVEEEQLESDEQSAQPPSNIQAQSQPSPAPAPQQEQPNIPQLDQPQDNNQAQAAVPKLGDDPSPQSAQTPVPQLEEQQPAQNPVPQLEEQQPAQNPIPQLEEQQPAPQETPQQASPLPQIVSPS